MGVNYPPGGKARFFGGNAEPKPQCCSVLWADHCAILRVIRHNHCLGLGNGSNKFGKHCFKWLDLKVVNTITSANPRNLFAIFTQYLHKRWPRLHASGSGHNTTCFMRSQITCHMRSQYNLPHGSTVYRFEKRIQRERGELVTNLSWNGFEVIFIRGTSHAGTTPSNHSSPQEHKYAAVTSTAKIQIEFGPKRV